MNFSHRFPLTSDYVTPSQLIGVRQHQNGQNLHFVRATLGVYLSLTSETTRDRKCKMYIFTYSSRLKEFVVDRTLVILLLTVYQ